MHRVLRRRNNYLAPSGLLFNEAPGHEFETEAGRVQVADSFPAYASRLSRREVAVRSSIGSSIVASRFRYTSYTLLCSTFGISKKKPGTSER